MKKYMDNLVRAIGFIAARQLSERTGQVPSPPPPARQSPPSDARTYAVVAANDDGLRDAEDLAADR